MSFGASVRDSGSVPIAQGYIPGTGLVAAQSSTISNTDGSSNTSAPLVMHRAPGTVLNQASAAVIVSGNSADLAVGPYTEVAVDINITAVSGTTPTLQVFVDRKGIDGVYYPLWQSNSVTAIGQVSTAIGSGCTVAQSLGTVVRLRWVLTGTSPSFTLSASILGK
jgi:hypothetical protein